mmetsp:Transcript_39682/g.76019  ORF Transcript_39682/g.76019 Transcript_39682/m.76019 type:complete len:200 (-) Transcript_39682:607-1206(-)
MNVAHRSGCRLHATDVHCVGKRCMTSCTLILPQPHLMLPSRWLIHQAETRKIPRLLLRRLQRRHHRATATGMYKKRLHATCCPRMIAGKMRHVLLDTASKIPSSCMIQLLKRSSSSSSSRSKSSSKSSKNRNSTSHPRWRKCVLLGCGRWVFRHRRLQSLQQHRLQPAQKSRSPQRAGFRLQLSQALPQGCLVDASSGC